VSLVLEPTASSHLVGWITIDIRATAWGPRAVTTHGRTHTAPQRFGLAKPKWLLDRPEPCGPGLKSGQQLCIPFSVSETLFLI
jgi:hypothetical protein